MKKTFCLFFRKGLTELVIPFFMALPIKCLRQICIRLFIKSLGKKTMLCRNVEFIGRNIWIGNHCAINKKALLDGRGELKIGNNVDIARDVHIWTAEHAVQSDFHQYITAPVVIEDYVWIASRATILPGVTIGKGAVVAAGSVVTKNIPTMTIVGGNPARTIGVRNSKLKYILEFYDTFFE